MIPLSIVMPAYNEADHIEACVLEWYAQVISRIPGSELIIVDDCSRDDTGARLQGLAARLPALRALTTPANGGHGRALRFGLEHARGEFVFHTDSDRQHTPDDFPAVWERRTAADFVFGIRDHRADGAFRAGVSSMMRVVNLMLWGDWIQDANCPYKLMRRTSLDELLAAIPRSSFIPMVMVSVLARRRGFRVCEVPVRHFPRIAGQQSLKGVLKWARVSRRCVGELVRLRLAQGQRRRPQDSATDLSRQNTPVP
jgi:glycosyltransferase involved in cell wall biosynthesis